MAEPGQRQAKSTLMDDRPKRIIVDIPSTISRYGNIRCVNVAQSLKTI